LARTVARSRSSSALLINLSKHESDQFNNWPICR